MPYLYPLIATSWTGETVLLPDAAAAGAFIRGKTIGDHFGWIDAGFSRILGTWQTLWRPIEWILRDDGGRVVSPGDLPAPAPCPRRPGSFEHRNGPVPGLRHRPGRTSAATRKRHGGRGVAARIAAFHTGDPLREQD